MNHLYGLYHAKRAELEKAAEEEKLNGEKAKPPSDVLGALVRAQMDAEAEAQGKKAGLEESEVIGNMWIFLLAGEDTTANVLTFTQAYLALYPEWQDKVYDEITAACGDGLPTYQDLNQLPLTLAVCLETLRLRDIILVLPRVAVEDTTLPYTTWDAAGTPTPRTQHIKAGSHVVIDSPACSLNAHKWGAQCETNFDPTRFLDSSQVYTGFSLGQRQCIGKRFAEVEMVAFLAHLIKQFKLFPVYKDGESEEKMRQRLSGGYEEFILIPYNFGMRYELR